MPMKLNKTVPRLMESLQGGFSLTSRENFAEKVLIAKINLRVLD
jgi:hypothetical protein